MLKNHDKESVLMSVLASLCPDPSDPEIIYFELWFRSVWIALALLNLALPRLTRITGLLIVQRSLKCGGDTERSEALKQSIFKMADSMLHV